MPPFAPLDFYIGQWTPLPSQPSGPLLQGKNVIITGANSGIGLVAAQQLAALEPENLVLACRNLKTGAEALESLFKKYPNAKATVWELDLASFDSVKAFGERANKELGRVDVAVLNAGMNPGFAKDQPMRRTDDGHEVTHQVNSLGTILLALLLAPALHKSFEPRLVLTSSEVHAWADPTPIANAVRDNRSILETMDDEALYDSPDRYFVSKLLLQFVVRHLIPAMPKVIIASVNPGMCATNLGRDVKVQTWQDFVDVASFIPQMFFMRGAGRGALIVTSATRATESTEYWHVGRPGAVQSVFMGQMSGMKASKQYFEEVLALCEKLSPGCTAVLKL